MAGKRWTKEELDYVKGHWPDEGSSEVAKALSRTKISVQSKAKKLNLHRSYFGDKNHPYGANLRRRYNMTIEDYDRLLEEQNYVCAICGQEETSTNQYGVKRLCVDHDHKTGTIRGLLCMRCNMMIGSAKDNYMILINAVYYLTDSKSRDAFGALVGSREAQSSRKQTSEELRVGV